MEPKFLSLNEALHIHRDQAERYGGSADVRDLDLLKKVFAKAEAGFGEHYVHSGLFEAAAGYLCSVVRGKPFAEGNLRTATLAALVFLELNGVPFQGADAQLKSTVNKLAKGRIGLPAVTQFLRENSGGAEGMTQ